MKRGKHTSGPWKVYYALLRPQFPGNRIIEIQDDHGKPIVIWPGFDNSDRLKKTHLANARVMAASPTMLEMMKRARPILANFCESEENLRLYNEFCNAIAKAEGRR
jgi:hypothetical protein